MIMKKILWLFIIVFIFLAVTLLVGMIQEEKQAENLYSAEISQSSPQQ